jgi:hypothetical protein
MLARFTSASPFRFPRESADERLRFVTGRDRKSGEDASDDGVL